MVTPGVKRLRREADHSPSSNTEVTNAWGLYEGVSKSFRTGRLERELQMVQLCAISCSCIASLWVSLVSFAAVALYVASQRVFVVVAVRKLLGTLSYIRYTTIVFINCRVIWCRMF